MEVRCLTGVLAVMRSHPVKRPRFRAVQTYPSSRSYGDGVRRVLSHVLERQAHFLDFGRQAVFCIWCGGRRMLTPPGSLCSFEGQLNVKYSGGQLHVCLISTTMSSLVFVVAYLTL